MALKLSETCVKCEKYLKKVCVGIEVVSGSALQYCRNKLSTTPMVKPKATKK